MVLTENVYSDQCSSPGYFMPLDGDGFPVQQYFYDKYQCIPNLITISEVFAKEGISDLIRDTGARLVWSKDSLYTEYPELPVREGEVYETNGIIIQKSSFKLFQEDCLEYVIKIYYTDSAKDTAMSYADMLKKYISKRPTKGKISLIKSTQMGFETTSFDVKIEPFDVGMHYGQSFVPVYESILKRLNNKSDKGIVLLHGTPGGGKTSLIKLLCKNIEDKEIIFVPPYLAESISSPDFLPFLIDHPNSVLVIEDAEKVLLNRDTGEGSTQGVSNILNIGDGILGECLGIQIIATFNTKRDNIDKALLRKGRLIAEYEFKALSVEDSNRLLVHLGFEPIAKNPMTLAEIYGINKEEYKSKVAEIPSIGFNTKRY